MKKIILLLVLLLFGLCGCSKQSETVIDVNNDDKPVEVEPVNENNDSETVIVYSDGEWVSLDENIPFTLAITGDSVVVNGVKGLCQIAEDNEHQYIISFTKENSNVEEDMFMYFDLIDENTGVIWLPDDNDEFLYQVKIANNSTPSETEIISNDEKPAQKPENQNKPSENTPSQGSGTEKPSTQNCRDVEVLVKDAWDEQVLVRKGECTTVKIKDAWDEDPYCSAYEETVVYVCNGCGLTTSDYDTIRQHINFNHANGCDGFHNGPGEVYCSAWSPGAHHDAVYEQRCEPDEYSTVHHEAVYETLRVCD